MEANDRKRFVKCLLGCAEVYGREVSENVLELWWGLLKDHPIEAIEGAFARHMKSPDAGQFMAKPADIVKMLTGTSLDAAMIAWTSVDRAVRHVGPYASPAFEDPIIMRVLADMGGWVHVITVRGKSDDEWPFVATEFRKRYEGYKAQGEVPEAPDRLTGIGEMETSARGLPFDEGVVVIRLNAGLSHRGLAGAKLLEDQEKKGK